MQNNLTKLESKALRLAEEFTENILKDISPDGKCFTVCYLLSNYLKMLGVDNSISCGEYDSLKHNKKIHHFWIRITGSCKILDPTILQFEKLENVRILQENFINVYIGPETKEKYILMEGLNNEQKTELTDVEIDEYINVIFNNPTTDYQLIFLEAINFFKKHNCHSTDEYKHFFEQIHKVLK